MNTAAFGELVALALDGPRSAADTIRWGSEVRTRIRAFEHGDTGHYLVGSLGTEIIGLILRDVRKTECEADELLEQLRAQGEDEARRMAHLREVNEKRAEIGLPPLGSIDYVPAPPLPADLFEAIAEQQRRDQVPGPA